jgi:hypothetical protein
MAIRGVVKSPFEKAGLLFMPRILQTFVYYCSTFHPPTSTQNPSTITIHQQLLSPILSTQFSKNAANPHELSPPAHPSTTTPIRLSLFISNPNVIPIRASAILSLSHTQNQHLPRISMEPDYTTSERFRVTDASRQN